MAQSDIERQGIDVSGNVDVLSLQVAEGRTTDNVDAVASLLTSRTRSASVTLGTPLASLLRIIERADWLPTLSYSMQRVHQYGAGIPTGGLLTAFDIPDQLSVVQDFSAQWTVQRWQLAYHVKPPASLGRSTQHLRKRESQLALEPSR